MCGRYSLYSKDDAIAKYFEATLQYHFKPSYNIAPTATVPVLIVIEGERLIVPMRWGLIPSWHKESQNLTVLNNAKIETIDMKPSFRSSFKRHRCLILADGFYEWDAASKPKQPYYFHRKDNEPIALAGIWDRWVSENESIDSCCIITEPANKLVGRVHDRMPAIITTGYYNKWLDNEMQEPQIAKEMAIQADAYNEIESYPVTSKMNRVVFNNLQCILKMN